MQMSLVLKVSIFMLLSVSISFCSTKHCHDSMSNAEYTSCLSSVSDSLENKLKITYKEFLAQHNNDKIYQAKIKASQLIWIKYRDSELEMAFPHSEDDRYYWTGLNACYLQRKIILTKQRIIRLKTFDKTMNNLGCTTYPID